MPDIPILITLGTVLVLFVCFAKQVASVELIALGAASFLLAFNILSIEDLLSVFANPAAMTVAAMFVLSAALEKTGAIDSISKTVIGLTEKSIALAIGIVFAFAFVGSFFINNTSIVVILIPVLMATARKTKKPASKLLLPLSYISIMGGACTLIGTSTNLLVDGVARNMGLAPFSMFEITVPALIMAAIGGAYLLLIGSRTIPVRNTLSDTYSDLLDRKFLSQIYISSDSSFLGKTLIECGFIKEKGYEIVEHTKKAEDNTGQIARFLKSPEVAKVFRSFIQKKDVEENTNVIDMNLPLQEGDRVVVLAGQREILQHEQTETENQEQATPKPSRDDINEDESITMEGIVAPDSRFVGKTIEALRFDAIYDVYPLALHRQNETIKEGLRDIQLAVGDTILLKGKESELRRLFKNGEILNLSKPLFEPFQRKKVPIAVLAITLAVSFAALGITSIAASAFIAAVAVVITGCLTNKDAYHALHGEVLLLIYAMLAISIAMQNTGALAFIVDGIMALVSDLPPFVIISIIYLLTSILTEMFSNNATAVMLTPVAIGLAVQLGMDPRPFAAAIMLGASSSFATPIGYQTNTLVYNAGGYKFTDFLRVGLPMNIIMWLTASFVIPWYWDM